MKKIIILLTIIFIIIGGSFIAVGKSSKNHKLINALTFSDIDLNKIWVFEGNKGLSYDYKIGYNDSKQISDQLIQSTKIDMKKSFPNNYSQGFTVTIFFKSDINGITREINIMPKNDNSVFAIIKIKNKQGGLINWWGLSVESSWLSKYIDNVDKV
ncbi:MAG: hypothetical protein ACREV6_20330 [Clostridium sp.]|uniref:hypothetical protein n=1 Tax=Clostridium sp. TaxID=1506 RepID=UPI003D6DA31E